MFKILRQAIKSGVLTNRFPATRSEHAAGFQGKPVIDYPNCIKGDLCADSCPTGAISFKKLHPASDRPAPMAELTLDYGKCIFCGECMLAAPDCVTIAPEMPPPTTKKEELLSGAVYQKDKRIRWRFTRSSPVATKAEKEHVSNVPIDELGQSIHEKISRMFGRSLHIRQVDAGSCNGCEVEIASLSNPIYDIERFGVHFVASPRHADILLVTGPVTRNMEIALKQTYDATPDPKLVVAVGACGISGGIFGTSYASQGGVDNVVPVDVYIPGCPPSPEALLQGILLALGRWPGRT